MNLRGKWLAAGVAAMALCATEVWAHASSANARLPVDRASAGVSADRSVRRTRVAGGPAWQGACRHVHLHDLQGRLPDPDREDGLAAGHTRCRFRPACAFRVDHRRTRGRHARRAQRLCPRAQRRPRGLELPDRIERRDPGRRAALRRVREAKQSPATSTTCFLTSLVDRQGHAARAISRLPLRARSNCCATCTPCLRE